MKPFIIYSLFAPAALMAQERPNILYIMTDQQTATAMSCAGNEAVPEMKRCIPPIWTGLPRGACVSRTLIAACP